MEIKIKGFITSKQSELYSDCADSYAINTNTHKFAISDGVSKSFFSEVWSKILVEEYVNNRDSDEKTLLEKSQQTWSSIISDKVDKPETKWFTKVQYKRKSPAQATFVGLELNMSEKNWNVIAQGDSFLFFVPNGGDDVTYCVSSKPKSSNFDNFPDYLSSIGNMHKGKYKREKIPLTEGVFYLMTDALAEWFLKDTSMAVSMLSNIKTQEQYLETIEKERNAKNLHDDDSAVLMLEITNPVIEDVICESLHVSDLSKLISEQATQISNEKEQEKNSTSSNAKHAESADSFSEGNSIKQSEDLSESNAYVRTSKSEGTISCENATPKKAEEVKKEPSENPDEKKEVSSFGMNSSQTISKF